MSDIPALLRPIKDRLAAGTDAAPVPWEAVGTGVQGGDHWYVCAEDQSIASIACRDGENEEQREPLARLFASAPTDQAKLIAAIEAVESLATAWQARGEHLLTAASAREFPDGVAESLSESGADFVHNAKLVRAALSLALGGDTA